MKTFYSSTWLWPHFPDTISWIFFLTYWFEKHDRKNCTTKIQNFIFGITCKIRNTRKQRNTGFIRGHEDMILLVPSNPEVLALPLPPRRSFVGFAA